MAQFNVTSLDFDEIKKSMIDYFKANPKYADWNFDGSGLSVLMDVLAYNTHYNALLAHTSMNETFLDSAQLRGNVVGHAKLLGYVPRSALSSTISLEIEVPTGGITPQPDTITIDRGTRFSTTVSGIQYSFVTLNTVSATLVDGVYTFSKAKGNEVVAREGILKRMLYRVDELVTNQKFVIPDVNADTTTLRVRVKSNQESTDYSIYSAFSTLSGLNDTSQIYFLQENAQGLYEVYFGDGTIGSKLTNNQIVEIEYVYTEGAKANGGTDFTAVDSIGGTIPNSIVPIDDGNGNSIKSYGGAPRETIESIRYNAPLTYITQNRAVTANDYQSILLREVGNIQAISVWGGENDFTPNYGKVYICIKPTGAEALTAEEKSAIINILKGKNVVSITPIMVDPEYTNLALDVFFKYNPNLTDRSKIELESLIRNTVNTFNDDNLEKFDGVFRSSALLRAIDYSDVAVLNSDVRVFMYKDVAALSNVNNYFELKFTSPIYSTSSTESVIQSGSFITNGVTHFFGDSLITGSTNRQVYIYRVVNGIKTSVIADAGIIYSSEGRMIIKGFRPDANSTIRITVIPNSNDLAPNRNQLLRIDPLSLNITGDVDTIALAGSSGTINYTTPSRHR